MRKTAASYAEQSDPTRNRNFSRRWTETPVRLPNKPLAEPIKLIEIPYALNAEGSPRAALLVPPMPAALDRRPVRRVFDSLGAAIAAKRMMEASR
jgi:hypothetical protein